MWSITLALILAQNSPTSFPLKFIHSGVINAEHGNIEAIDVSGPDGFAARLFVEQATSLPLMISYAELMNPQAGYVVTTGTATAAEMQELAVQLYFSDYRSVNGVRLPFLITKAVNGVLVDEWRVEKYKLNPDLKPKKFEKK